MALITWYQHFMATDTEQVGDVIDIKRIRLVLLEDLAVAMCHIRI